MTMPTTATGENRRLEAGWFQRLAWTALVWGSLGFLAWVPFLYAAIRRGLLSDWTAVGAFFLYEGSIVTMTAVSGDDDADAYFGLTFMTALLTATVLLLFAVFDKKPQQPAPAYGAAQGNPYQQGYPYGR
ncbi:hypothetical protein GCM10010269_29060 [Streptomyces humidus]|uniref:Uncharacterized protein n=1 Tax=Streptomyces humidus TaxID=52259 RepID=A0A918FW66_9ACTN|nr:hypothetical protein [Streptomyces humidus]GGR88056.1 hypothetical protein GCM10010269_29060 [Streptomyces humidus]